MKSCLITFKKIKKQPPEVFYEKAGYTNADLKISRYVYVHINIIPENFAFLILRILELFSCTICKMFLYKHTETIEYVKK